MLSHAERRTKFKRGKKEFRVFGVASTLFHQSYFLAFWPVNSELLFGVWKTLSLFVRLRKKIYMSEKKWRITRSGQNLKKINSKNLKYLVWRDDRRAFEQKRFFEIEIWCYKKFTAGFLVQEFLRFWVFKEINWTADLIWNGLFLLYKFTFVEEVTFSQKLFEPLTKTTIWNSIFLAKSNFSWDWRPLNSFLENMLAFPYFARRKRKKFIKIASPDRWLTRISKRWRTPILHEKISFLSEFFQVKKLGKKMN